MAFLHGIQTNTPKVSIEFFSPEALGMFLEFFWNNTWTYINTLLYINCSLLLLTEVGLHTPFS